MVTITTTSDAEAERMAVLMASSAPVGVNYAIYLNGSRIAGRATGTQSAGEPEIELRGR